MGNAEFGIKRGGRESSSRPSDGDNQGKNAQAG